MNRDEINTTIREKTVLLDRPLRGMPHPFDKLHPRMYAAELVGTALLVFFGLSISDPNWLRGFGKDGGSTGLARAWVQASR